MKMVRVWVIFNSPFELNSVSFLSVSRDINTKISFYAKGYNLSIARPYRFHSVLPNCIYVSQFAAVIWAFLCFCLLQSTLRWKCIFFSIPLRPLFKDHLMALFVLFLTIIDMLILLLYTVAEAVRNDIGVKLTPNQELPEETFGVSAL